MPWEIGTPYPSSLAPKTLVGLPNPAGLRTGASFAVTDYGGNIATVVAGAWRFEYPFRTTWAGRPAVGLVPTGTELQVTDYANQKWVNDGTVWRPAQGRASLFADCADVEKALASLSGVTQGVFTTPTMKIPAGMIIPDSQIVITTRAYKTGTGGSVRFVASLGTTNTIADPGIMSSVSGAGTNSSVFAQCAGVFGDIKTRMMAIGYGEGAISTPVGVSPFFYTTNIDTDADMFITFWVTNGNVADVFNLTSYKVCLEA